MPLGVRALVPPLAALERADSCLERYGQRYAEPLILIIRARAMRALGADAAAVRDLAARARALADDRGAGLFARRAQSLLDELAGAPTTFDRTPVPGAAIQLPASEPPFR